MPFIGTKLGPYEILSAIGAGGMGEVYRARDPRIGREVAIKVLPTHFSQDSERLHRFEQEARATGALNHPNIVAVYDIGTENSSPYLVSEFLQGGTLRKRIADGPLPLRKTIEYALQIANGLSAAHDKTIVHRDLKPENIFVTKEGRVKILDFGLAKLTHPEVIDSKITAAATRLHQTESGVLLGTILYMSPEQVRGLKVDHRSDIFAFGTILYEMLSGKRPFHGESQVEVMHAILKTEPVPLTQGSSVVPPTLERIVQRCLEKDPDQRFQSTSDLAFALESFSSASSSKTDVLPAQKPQTLVRYFTSALLTLAIATAIFYAGKEWGPKFLSSSNTADLNTPSSFQQYTLLTFGKGIIRNARFTADGNTIIYSAAWSGNPFSVYTTRVDNTQSMTPLSLPSAYVLSVSSAGELALLLLPQRTLAVVPISGGIPREIQENIWNADWAPNGKDMAIHKSVNYKDRIEYPIGKVLYETLGDISLPAVSPDANHVAFIDHPEVQGPYFLSIVDRAGKKRNYNGPWQRIMGLVWHPSGNEVWVDGPTERGASAIFAIELNGNTRVVEKREGYVSLQDISVNGDALISRINARVETWGRVDGETSERNFSWLDGTHMLDISDDGQTVFLNEIRLAGEGIYMRKVDMSAPIRLRDGVGSSVSPDGKWVLALGDSGMSLIPTGAGEIKHLDASPVKNLSAAAFFPDGKRILINGNEPGHNWRLFTLELNGGKPKPVSPEGIALGPQGACTHPVSNDGTLIAGWDGNNKIRIFSVDSGLEQSVKGVQEREVVLRWCDDHRSFYVANLWSLPVQVFKVKWETGSRELIKEIKPVDPAGVRTFISLQITPDGKSYFYSFDRHLVDLYLARGLK